MRNECTQDCVQGRHCTCRQRGDRPLDSTERQIAVALVAITLTWVFLIVLCVVCYA